MYLHTDHLPEGTLLQGYDLCIIGAGAAGIAIAQRLIGTSVKVLLLTNGAPGDRGRPAQSRQAIYDGTAGEFLQKVDPIFLQRSRLNMYGGTTNHFGFWSLPMHPADFEARPGFREASWPIELSELSPYYADAHKFGDFGPFNYEDMSFWEQAMFGHAFDPLPDDALTGIVMRAQYAEEWHDFQLQFGEALKNAPNITVLFNAHVLELESTEGKNHVTGLLCGTIEDGQRGRDFRIQAKDYALAAGGIESVRLLKLSDDLGNNAKDQLGRGFMVHPLLTNAAKVRFEQAVKTEVRNFFRDQQVRLKPPTNGEDGYAVMSVPLVNPELVFEYNVFNAWGVLVPTYQTLHDEKIGNFRFVLRFDHTGQNAELNLNWEQVPNEDSRITLDEGKTDPIFGQPVTHLDWQMREEDKQTCVRAMALVEDYLGKRGGADFELLTDLSGGPADWSFQPHVGALETGDHHMGAMRMSENPQDGIVDPNAKVHNVDNLYVAGCGIFPTSGFANPTLTIVALSLRLADHIKSLN